MWSPIDGQNTCSFRRGQINGQIIKKGNGLYLGFLVEASFHGFFYFQMTSVVRLGVSLTQDSTPTWSLWFFIVMLRSSTPWTNTSKSPLAVEWWQKKWKLASSPLASSLEATTLALFFGQIPRHRFLSYSQCDSIYRLSSKQDHFVTHSSARKNRTSVEWGLEQPMMIWLWAKSSWGCISVMKIYNMV